jgi:hypothetical protein
LLRKIEALRGPKVCAKGRKRVLVYLDPGDVESGLLEAQGQAAHASEQVKDSHTAKRSGFGDHPTPAPGQGRSRFRLAA